MESVQAGRRPRTDGFDNIRSIAMVFATVEALRHGGECPVLDAEIKMLVSAAEGMQHG
jgi:hypothetical protein